MKKKASGKGLEIDHKESEVFFLYETLGNPKVFYACKANRYFKDAECTNAFSDAELQALGMPIPIQIETARKKMIQASIDSGDVPDMMQVFLATAPQKLEYPERLRGKIQETAGEDRVIQRINRASSRY
jgi:hypothetical protein